ncbi:hypothetical protein [Bordetella hinzii]|uniref:hypothetical protein n=1 Tax=Bordetella hinzii TaxID=103855 RepID=UPI000764AC47|nr:hypothetical protein [Bordetella hinzii]KXA71083.1 hypothetical protein AXA74_20485 [Bordetella hinzii LMG 13501]VEH23193.1 Uncharacterised protein [Bordetella hinzii]VEH33576.1 Uncharacterised protein [Bordetella hinzii]
MTTADRNAAPLVPDLVEQSIRDQDAFAQGLGFLVGTLRHLLADQLGDEAETAAGPRIQIGPLDV